MKVFNSLLFVGALTGTSGFVAQNPSVFKKTSSLEASYYGGRGGDQIVSDRQMSSVGSSTSGGALTNAARRSGSWDSRSRDGYGSGYGYGSSRYGNRYNNRYSNNRYSRGGYGNRRGWDTFEPTIVQGGSLETWSFPSVDIDRVQVRLATEGRPLNANVELWQGPDNSPQKMGVYLEDGATYPFNAVIASPRGSNAIAIRNTGQLEFPLEASVEEDRGSGMWDIDYFPMNARTVQGGAVYTEPFPPGVESVQLMLRTDGRPLNARIELLQGPNNNKQVMEIYTEDGYERPFLCVLETPEVGNVIRIVNTATVEFPLTASLEPFAVESGYMRGGNYDHGYSNENRLDGSTTSGSRPYNVGYGQAYGGGYENRRYNDRYSNRYGGYGGNGRYRSNGYSSNYGYGNRRSYY